MQKTTNHKMQQLRSSRKTANTSYASLLTVLRPRGELDDSFGKGRELVLLPRPLTRLTVRPHLELRLNKRLATAQSGMAMKTHKTPKSEQQ